MNNTVQALGASTAGLEIIRDSTSDLTVKAALDLDITGLRALQDSTSGQISDANDQMAQLEELNATLRSFNTELEDFSARMQDAREGAANLEGMGSALDSVSITLAGLNSSFDGARTQLSEIEGLLSDVKASSAQIEGTLDDAIMQTSSVDALISSLQTTVAEQTGKDPAVIASPLSVKVENQYKRASFVDYLMPQVIAVSLLFSCFFLAAISVVREKTKRTIVRALLAPDAFIYLTLAKIATLVLISFLQVGMILILATLLFGVKPPGDIGMLLWGTSISALVLSSIGVLVGFYARGESAAIQSCLLLAIPMLFLGNIMFSPDLLPSYTQVLQQLLPLAHVTNIFKVVLITNGNPGIDIAALLSYFVVLAVLLGYVVLKRRDISNYR